MFRHTFTPATLAFVLGVGVLVSSFRADALSGTTKTDKKDNGLKVEIQDLHPFTHLAYIPAGTDPATIRFEKSRVVAVPTRIKHTTDTNYCNGLEFRDPGGSMYCPDAAIAASDAAYELTYSFQGQPLASDEFRHGHFTFQVYFRPEELPEDVRAALGDLTLNRADKAARFKVDTRRETIERVGIDESQSRFCDGSYQDGSWTPADPKCRDEIRCKTVVVPSDYLTVEVEPVPAR